MPKISKARKEECSAALLKLIQPGDTIYTVLRHVSRSGMQRRIDLYKMTEDGPLYLSKYAAAICAGAI